MFRVQQHVYVFLVLCSASPQEYHNSSYVAADSVIDWKMGEITVKKKKKRWAIT